MAGKFASKIMALAFATMLSACASSRMTDLPQPPAVAAIPAAGTATVVFMRPSMLGGAIQSSVFDISSNTDALVGIVSSGKKIAYSVSPGLHRFMVVGESADFMDADLTAGKTYHARVDPRLGIWKARFSLVPVPANSPDLSNDLAGCSWVENTAASRQWAAENIQSIAEKRTEYLPDWEKKSSKPFLPASAGR